MYKSGLKACISYSLHQKLHIYITTAVHKYAYMEIQLHRYIYNHIYIIVYLHKVTIYIYWYSTNDDFIKLQRCDD